MTDTRFGPVEKAEPTVRGVASGSVHDPKASMGRHAGSAGLSTVADLGRFLGRYLKDVLRVTCLRIFAREEGRPALSDGI